jgi:Protein of unknown function (DUF2384)
MPDNTRPARDQRMPAVELRLDERLPNDDLRRGFTVMSSYGTAATRMVPQIMKLYTPTGKIDARRVAKTLDVPIAAVAKGFGLKADTVRKYPTSEAVQPPAQQLVGVLMELASYFKGNDLKAALVWMRQPNPELGNRSPMQVYAQGHLDVVADLVRAIGTGQTT